MASIYKERKIRTSPEAAWDALRDWGALHQRLAPGFVTDLRLDDGDRIITFFNGHEARERLISLSDEHRRLVWSSVDGPFSHYNGAAQVLAGADGGCRFIWITDLLPDDLATNIDAMMERGIDAIKENLERADS